MLSNQNNYYRGHLDVKNLVVNGLSDFKQVDGCVSLSGFTKVKLKLGLQFDEVKLVSEYEGQLNLFEMIDMFGKGNLE